MVFVIPLTHGAQYMFSVLNLAFQQGTTQEAALGAWEAWETLNRSPSKDLWVSSVIILSPSVLRQPRDAGTIFTPIYTYKYLKDQGDTAMLTIIVN